MNRNWLTVVLACSGTLALVAQPPPHGDMMHHGPGGPGGPGMAGFARDMKVVKGQPYTADVVSESTQVLGDGTKIAKKVSGAVYRDVDGRTRREETTSEGRKIVNIFDPVAGVSMSLNPTAKTASRQQMHVPTAGAAQHGGRPGPERANANHPERANNRVVEDLGNQAIEGIQAQGRRTTRTIAAGTMGNDHDIKIIDEVWTSPDLQVVVQSHHSDPWGGDVTYKLANVRRGDQPSTLFQAPGDYQVQDVKFGRHPGAPPAGGAQQQ
jgi:hypothetical protein